MEARSAGLHGHGDRLHLGPPLPLRVQLEELAEVLADPGVALELRLAVRTLERSAIGVKAQPRYSLQAVVFTGTKSRQPLSSVASSSATHSERVPPCGEWLSSKLQYGLSRCH